MCTYLSYIDVLYVLDVCGVDLFKNITLTPPTGSRKAVAVCNDEKISSVHNERRHYSHTRWNRSRIYKHGKIKRGKPDLNVDLESADE